MKLFLFLFGTILSFSALAQEKKSTRPMAIKIYNQTTININANHGVFDSSRILVNPNGIEIQYLHPTIAIELKNKLNDVHEIEITSLNWSKNTGFYNTGSQGKWAQVAIALRYEYKLVLNKKNTKDWQASIGFGASPYFSYSGFTPIITNDYPVRTTSVGISAFVIPGINYNLSSKVFLDANIPICIGVASWDSYKIANPTLPYYLQKSSLFNFEGGVPRISLRLGIGLRI